MRWFFLCSVLGALCSLAGCRGVTPLGERIPVGTGPFAIVVGEGTDNQTDLFALEASGGEVVRLTFTRGREAAASLHPAGTVVGFLRRDPGTGDSSAASFVPRMFTTTVVCVPSADSTVKLSV